MRISDTRLWHRFVYEPPQRDPGFEWFDRGRMIAILSAIVAGTVLPAITVHQPPDAVDDRYAVRDGFHRFYACVALAFTRVPVPAVPFFDLQAWQRGKA